MSKAESVIQNGIKEVFEAFRAYEQAKADGRISFREWLNIADETLDLRKPLFELPTFKEAWKAMSEDEKREVLDRVLIDLYRRKIMKGSANVEGLKILVEFMLLGAEAREAVKMMLL